MKDDGWRLGFRPGLDGLRGVAIGAVLLLHWWPHDFGGGSIGVDLFFVLSGFLITRLIAEEIWTTGRLDLLAFYRRRFRRLVPAATLLAAACAWTPGAIWVVLYGANWARIDGGPIEDGPLDHTWSLAIEEQFYVVWPVVVILLLRTRWAPLIAAGGVVLVALHRLVLLDAGASASRVYNGTDTRIDAMLLGAVLALAAPRLLRFPFWSVIAATVAPLLAVVVVDSPSLIGWGWTLVAAAWAVVLLWAVTADGWIAHRSLRWVGRLSYSLYLWHYPVTWLVRGGEIHNTSALGTAVAIPLSFLLAIASHRFVENRFRAPATTAMPATPRPSPAAGP